MTDDLFFKRNEKNLEIFVSSGSHFFETKSEENFRHLIIKISIFFFIVTFTFFFIYLQLLIISGIFLLLLLKIYLDSSKKILFKVSANGIDVKYGKHILSIKREDIDSLQCITNIEEISEKLRKENIIEEGSTLDEPMSYKVVLKTRGDISLFPIRKVAKKEFCLFEIGKLYEDTVLFLEKELEEMLNLNKEGKK